MLGARAKAALRTVLGFFGGFYVAVFRKA